MFKKDGDIPPLPPPPGSNPPSYTHASMCGRPDWGVVANHMPAASAADFKETADGLNVFCIKGYSGFVPFNKLDSPVETIGRLETLKQIQHGRHDYDPSKLEAPPRPPTPSEADMKKGADAKKTEFRTLIAELPKDECRFCKGDSGYPVRKIKRLDDTPLCWGCVFRNFHAEAELAWDGK